MFLTDLLIQMYQHNCDITYDIIKKQHLVKISPSMQTVVFDFFSNRVQVKSKNIAPEIETTACKRLPHTELKKGGNSYTIKVLPYIGETVVVLTAVVLYREYVVEMDGVLGDVVLSVNRSKH